MITVQIRTDTQTFNLTTYPADILRAVADQLENDEVDLNGSVQILIDAVGDPCGTVQVK